MLNPATEQEIGRLPIARQSDLDDALDAAERGFKLWSRTAPRVRAQIIMRAASLLRDRGPQIAPSITLENGKPLGQVLTELERYRHGRIVLSDSKLAAMEVSGVFDLDEPEALLRTLEQRYGLKVTYLPWLAVVH